MFNLDQNSDYTNKVTSTNTHYDICIDENITEVWGKDAIDQSIEIILMTKPRERLFNLNFGSPLYLVFFENFSNATEIINNALDVIEYWIPIKIIREEIQLELNKDENAIALQIPYISNDGLIAGVFSRRIKQ